VEESNGREEEMKKIVIFGASSAMAVETARCFAKESASFLLIARSDQKLESIRNDLLTRGAKEVFTLSSDLSNIDEHEKLLGSIDKVLPDYDTVLVAYGTLGDQNACQENYSGAHKEFNTNFFSVVSILTGISNKFEEKGTGTIAVITSVAGDRGRKSNYVYGTANGALSIFLQGLRVVDIKPGFVKTPMTEGLKQGPLFVEASVAGVGIHKAIKETKDVVYLPWFWRYIMLIIKLIPETIFKRLSL